MTPVTVDRVPNQEKTPRRTIRVPDDVWEAAHLHAAEERAAGKKVTVTDVVVRALKRYGRKS